MAISEKQLETWTNLWFCSAIERDISINQERFSTTPTRRMHRGELTASCKVRVTTQTSTATATWISYSG